MKKDINIYIGVIIGVLIIALLFVVSLNLYEFKTQNNESGPTEYKCFIDIKGWSEGYWVKTNIKENKTYYKRVKKDTNGNIIPIEFYGVMECSGVDKTLNHAFRGHNSIYILNNDNISHIKIEI